MLEVDDEVRCLWKPMRRDLDTLVVRFEEERDVVWTLSWSTSEKECDLVSVEPLDPIQSFYTVAALLGREKASPPTSPWSYMELQTADNLPDPRWFLRPEDRWMIERNSR